VMKTPGVTERLERPLASSPVRRAPHAACLRARDDRTDAFVRVARRRSTRRGGIASSRTAGRRERT
jgi:hypothetical protein